MIVQYASDLHLNREKNGKLKMDFLLDPVGDVLVLAGDITCWKKGSWKDPFFDFVADNFDQVIYVPGNHEFYGYHQDVSICEVPYVEAIRSNVRLVINSSIRIENVQFHCTPLWSYIPSDKEMYIDMKINDFRAIQYQDYNMTVYDYVNLHQRSKDWLEKSLHFFPAKKHVVITHHVPTYKCNPSKYIDSDINCAFVTEMYDFIHACKADYWVYGHHHDNKKMVEINGTKLVTNQLGYIEMGATGYRNNATFEI